MQRLLVALLLIACSKPEPRAESPAPGPDVPPVAADVPDEPPPLPDAGDDEPTPRWVDPGPTGPDAGPPVGDGHIGAACFLDEQCLDDALCLDWVHGYCTLLNCPATAQCPPGSACVDTGGGKTLCLATCRDASDCREHYGCKPFVGTDGTVQTGCFGLNEPAMATGGPCAEHADCEGSGACLTFVPEGYCAVLGCSEAHPCPAGAACVAYNGQPTCLGTCAVLDDCLVGGASERLCAPLLDTKSAVATVCIPAVDGEGVGAGCTTDVQCDSGECHIVADGKCVGSPLGCFQDDDCPGAGVCEHAPAYVKGVCTQACAGNLACPGNAICVKTLDSPAFCEVPCKGKSDTTSCDAAVGEACVFGDPVIDTTGAGKYACVVLKGGDPGMPCTEDGGCKGGGCLGSPGYCAPPCTLEDGCPFPATCVDHGGQLRCLARCFSVQDCPAGMACQATAGTAQKVCIP